MALYNNFSSEVHIKTLQNLPESVYFATGSVSNDTTISTVVSNVSESAIDKKITMKRVMGDAVVTRIEKPTNLGFKVNMVLDSDENPETIISQLGDLEEQSGIATGVYSYSESDMPKKRHRIAFIWSDGNEDFMKVYYNAFVESLFLKDTEVLELEMNFSAPVLDIQTGSGNYYEYEGTGASTVLSSIDTTMGW